MPRPYTEFKDKRLSKNIDYDKCYGYQCVDLIKLYLDQCLGYGKIGSLWNAKDIAKNAFFKDWYKFNFKGDNARLGDIIIASKWEYGHVAIVDRIVWDKIYVLEQNGTGKNSGSGKDGNEIIVKPYSFWFYNTVLRNEATTKVFNQERNYVLEKITERKKELDNTIEYYRAINGGYDY